MISAIWNSFQFSAETPFETRYFSASTTDGGETWTTDVSHIASATESEAEEYAAKAAEKGKTEGKTGTFRYRMTETDKKLLIVFVDCSRDTQLELKEWNASETIIDAVQSFEAPAVTKQIILQTDIAKELRMEGDAARIHQLVSLLVDNAVKYTPEGGTIRVRWWKNGKKAELAVENTCDNLPEGDLNRLFDRFYRADASRARESGGYGIGLSVAAAIVQAHKGKITAERTKDGICFRAVFPAK
ncbi:sensor histidine kinase [Fusicatenibacter sp.]